MLFGEAQVSDSNPKIGIEAILELQGTNREAKAYAFLYAAFRRTEISANPVRDALDCLTPFTAPYLNSISGTQISVEGIKDNLKADFGFDIPLYAIEQLVPALQQAGYVEYNRKVRAFFAKRQENQFDVVKNDIETDFDEVVTALSVYAREVGYSAEPQSGSWDEALISFLKTRTDQSGSKFINIKGALLESSKVEHAIVGAYLKKLHENSPLVFEKVLNVFMGVLVEEFISSVSEIGAVDLNKPVHVLYDTAVMLRLLGCSGRLLKTATDELTRYLQDLGFKIYYFSGNEAEVAGILDALIHIKDTGRELEGETAEAISSGEVTMTQIRMLQNAFPDRLAAMGVFPAETLERSAFENAKYQIDERGFSEYLKKQALTNKKNYGAQNRENDAGYLGAIMRLRGRFNTKDLANCGYVFVTSNKFLAQMSRRYLIEQKAVQPQHCPPILNVGQIATIAWLMKDKVLEPEKAGRELLSNCFAAIRPDQEWFRYFREGIEKVTGNIDEYGMDQKNALTLQAARRIAQEESFGESLIVRELNMVEILSRAEIEHKRILDEKDAQAATERERDAENAAAERAAAVRHAITQAEKEAEARHNEKRHISAYKKADILLKYLKYLAVLLFIIASAAVFYLQSQGNPSSVLQLLLVVLVIVNVFSFMDLLEVKFAGHVFGRVREKIANIFLT